MMARVRFWLQVVAVTGLIWVAADQRVTKWYEMTVPLSIEPQVPSQMRVEVLSPDPQTVKLLFKGPNQAINRLRTLTEPPQVVLRVPQRPTATYTLNLVEELRLEMDQFPSGLTISDVDPTFATVHVEQLVQKRVPIQVAIGGIELESPPQINPDTVMLTVPEQKFASMLQEQKSPVIEIEAESIFKDAPPGRRIEKSVAIPKAISGVPIIRSDPENVSIGATIRLRTRTGRIPTVPILLTQSKELSDRYEVIFDGQRGKTTVTQEIEIQGPSNLVGRIEEDYAKLDIHGCIYITLEDAAMETVLKSPRYHNLPPGVEVIQSDNRIRIQLIPREEKPTP